MEVFWQTAFVNGLGNLVPYHSDETGLFWFFGPSNWELMIKVLDGCSIDNHYWVFFATTTDQAYVINVFDQVAGSPRQYTNPLGRLSPTVGDTAAFLTCP